MNEPAVDVLVLYSVLPVEAKPELGIEQPLKRSRAFRKKRKISFQAFSKRIEQTPGRTRREVRMTRFPPFPKHLRDVTVGNGSHISGPDHDIVGLCIGHAGCAIGGDALVLGMPLLHDPAHCRVGKCGKIAENEPRVPTCQFDLAREAQVVADEHLDPSDDAGREGLVVRVSQAQHPRVIVGIVAMPDFEKPEVALTIGGEAVGFAEHFDVVCLQGALDLREHLRVGNWHPGMCRLRSWHRGQFPTADGCSAAVQDEVAAARGGRGDVHDFL